jgi:pimeloyl-ACP methyl ester carboxylesterase
MTPDTFDLDALIGRTKAIAGACLNRDPDFLASLTTANAARDMDLLHAAVGDKRLNYVGLSWGGMLGETYTSLFPGRTRAIVLDAPIDGDVWLNRPFDAMEEHRTGFEHSLHRFLAFAGRSEESYDELVAGPYGRSCAGSRSRASTTAPLGGRWRRRSTRSTTATRDRCASSAARSPARRCWAIWSRPTCRSSSAGRTAGSRPTSITPSTRSRSPRTSPRARTRTR